MSSDAAGSTTPVRQVTCPGCGGESLYGPQNPWRPFCSERCKNHDFGAWASERYRVAAQPDPADDDGETPPQEH
jgi:endogenous inhibitor of DNA gyrase (YacG/DUF329 family)